MKVELVAKNYRISDNLNNVLLKKLKKLDRYFDDDVKARVELSQSGKTCRLEISIPYYGAFLRSEVESDAMYNNIDLALPKLERQILKHSTILNEKQKMPLYNDEYAFVTGIEPSKTEISKVKQFEIDSISVEQATAELDMTDHDFYVFLNKNTKRVEVVYRRGDNTVGLLQPIPNKDK